MASALCRFVGLKGGNSVVRNALVRLQSTASSANLNLEEYKTHKLDSVLPSQTVCSRDDALHILTMMQRIRRMETTAGNMYKENRIRGFCHLYSGEEAVAVGVESTLQPGDTIITAYRCHGFTMTRGVSIYAILAELAGKKTGCCRGLGGSMHLFHKDFYGGNGIVGAQNLEKKIRKEVDEAAERCLADPSPEPIDGFCSPLVQTPPGFRFRGCDILTWYTPN